MENHDDAIEQVLNAILDPKHGEMRFVEQKDSFGESRQLEKLKEKYRMKSEKIVKQQKQ